MKTITLFVLLVFYAFNSNAQNIYKKLKALKDVKVESSYSPSGFKQAYKVMVKQPVNHKNPDSAFFWQKVWVDVINPDLPVVFITAGYYANYNYQSELAKLLGSNQIIVEHRYFGDSSPDSLDWRYLNLYQETEDLHHIRNILGKIFEGPWVASGISKGGQTTIAYKYFFPNDVNASVPYVAPMTFSKEDSRVIDFINNKVATKNAREKVLNFEKAVLENRDSIMPKFKDFAERNDMTFNKVGGIETGFEYGILEFSFSFWQWGYNVDQIPKDVTNWDSTMQILEAVNPFDFVEDKSVEKYKPYFYQALTEMGIYTYDTKRFTGLLKYATNPTYDFTIKDIPNTKYSNKLNLAMYATLKKTGNNMIFIYGGYDPWGSTAFEVDTTLTNSMRFIKKGGSHSTRISDFDVEIQNRILDSLSKWCDYNFENVSTNLDSENK